MQKYKEELQNFFENKTHLLSPKTQENMKKDILSVFESENEDEKILCQSTPLLEKFLKKDSTASYTSLKQYLDDLNIIYHENRFFFFPEDIYTGVIWRFIDVSGHVVASGGRYDILATRLGSPKPYGAS